MKERTAQGLGRTISVDIIELQVEQKMWKDGVLGQDQPRQLLDTIIYLLGIHLALHGGYEHRVLWHPGFNLQITVGWDPQGVKCLIYKEDPKTKTNQGGLDHKSIAPCTSYIYQSTDDQKCPVVLYEKYVSLLPKNGQNCALYLHPLNKPTPHQWYSDQPLGLNAIYETVKRLVNTVGVSGGKFTNHSLCATAVTRMFNGGIPEKVVKEITGHRSDAVHAYERTALNLKRKACETLQGKEQSKSMTETTITNPENIKKMCSPNAPKAQTEKPTEPIVTTLLDSEDEEIPCSQITPSRQIMSTAWGSVKDFLGKVSEQKI